MLLWECHRSKISIVFGFAETSDQNNIGASHWMIFHQQLCFQRSRVAKRCRFSQREIVRLDVHCTSAFRGLVNFFTRSMADRVAEDRAQRDRTIHENLVRLVDLFVL